MTTEDVFLHEYDLQSLRRVRPRGHEFEMSVTPRYEHHYVANEYEHATARLTAKLVTNVDTFIDVGAHYGFYSLLAAHQNPRTQVIAIEPTPISCEILRRNMDLCEVDRVEVHQAAVSGKLGVESFILSAASDNCSFYEHPNAPPIGRINVETISIDSLMQNRPSRRVLVKIDTEGHELAVLQGMTETLKGMDVRLIVEFNPIMQRRAGYEPEALLKQLDLLGFDLFLIDDQQFRFHRLRPGTGWRASMKEDSYGNLYCVQKRSWRITKPLRLISLWLRRYRREQLPL